MWGVWILGLAVVSADAEIVYEGDMALLERVRQSIASFETMYPHGKAKVDWQTYSGPAEDARQAEMKKRMGAKYKAPIRRSLNHDEPVCGGIATIYWKDAMVFAEFEGTLDSAQNAMPYRFLNNKSSQHVYSPQRKAHTIWPADSDRTEGYEILQLTPASSWLELPRFPLHWELLDPKILATVPRKPKKVIVSESGEKIEVRNLHRTNSGETRRVFLKSLGNVPELYESTTPPDAVFRVRWQWRKDAGGWPVLVQLTEEYLLKGEIFQKRVLKVLEFDGQFDPPASLFTTDSLKVDLGAQVTDFIQLKR